MFDIGFSELVMIGVLALIVLGPERLPKAARFAGLWVRRARAQWFSVKDELERELAADELKRSLHAARDTAQSVQDELRSTGDEARREFEAMRRATLARDAASEARADADADVAVTAMQDPPAPAPTPAPDASPDSPGAPEGGR
jgi:sec-independent protein translocase protein TatB